MSGAERNVRIGPISLFTLVAVVCLSLLAVLAVTTAHASDVMAQRQSDAASAQYVAETAGQTFVAGVDEALRSADASSAEGLAAAVGSRLSSVNRSAEDAVQGKASVTSSVDGNVVQAQVVESGGRGLDIRIEISADKTYRIAQWKTTSQENEAQSETLWSGASK